MSLNLDLMVTNNEIYFDVRSGRKTKQIVIYIPTKRLKTLHFQTVRYGKSMETNQRLAEAYNARFVVIKFGYVM